MCCFVSKERDKGYSWCQKSSLNDAVFDPYKYNLRKKWIPSMRCPRPGQCYDFSPRMTKYLIPQIPE